MMEKKILVTRSSMPAFDEYTAEIRDMWDSRWLTNMGAKHNRLQQELEQYLQVGKVKLVTNGHASLELALQGLQMQGEVITTPYTFISTTHAIVRQGLKPVFCDIDPVTYTMDPDKIEALITDKTCAIMPVHVYGNVCDVEKIEEIAKKHHLKVIYDAAHVFGVKYKGRGIASYGDVSCMSFHATKVFNTIEGGALCYSADKEETFGARIDHLKDFGICDEETIDAVGTNAKMNEFCAAMGLCNLRHVDEEIAKRKKAYETYFHYLEGVEGLQLNAKQKDVQQNYAYFPVVFDPEKFGANRDEVKETLAASGIMARKYFYPISTATEAYSHDYDPNDTPIAYWMSKNVLTLPMYADLQEEDVERICKVVLSCKK